MADDRDFTINGVEFKVNKINAMLQYHIVRRIGPILSEVIPAAVAHSKLSEDEQKDKMTDMLVPIFNGLSKLNDADATKVLVGLLTAIEMKQPTGNWARVSNGETILFQDLELPVLIQAAGKALMYNLAGFFAVLQRPS